MKRFLYFALFLLVTVLIYFIVISHLSLKIDKRRGENTSLAENKTSSTNLVAVDATVYRGLMQMLGIGNRCVDFSYQMKPDAEKVAASGADILMLSMYDDLDTTKYSRLGIKIVKCRDFMETSPLNRAIWMKIYGRLWGVGDRADSLYNIVEKQYNSKCLSTKNVTKKPSVFFDLMYGNIWYQPAEESSLGKMITDAGGVIPFNIKQKGGSLALSKEQVLNAAKDADFWIIRYNGVAKLTLERLKDINPIYSQFKAFRTGNVWACNTDNVLYFDETPFRPDYQLEDIIGILHPDIANKTQMRYFTKLR